MCACVCASRGWKFSQGGAAESPDRKLLKQADIAAVSQTEWHHCQVSGKVLLYTTVCGKQKVAWLCLLQVFRQWLPKLDQSMKNCSMISFLWQLFSFLFLLFLFPTLHFWLLYFAEILFKMLQEIFLRCNFKLKPPQSFPPQKFPNNSSSSACFINSSGTDNS